MKLTIPTTQSEITIKQYIDAQGKTEREQLAIYLNITPEVLDQLPQSVYDEALQFISKAMQEDQQEHHKRFFIGGTEFGFYPNLDEIESGSFAVAENTANDVNLAHEFLNAFYRPIKRSVASFYSVGNYVPRRAETLLNAPLSAYTSTMVFFLQYRERLRELYPELYTVSSNQNNSEMIEGFGLKWGWFHTFNIIGGGDYYKAKNAQNEPLGELLYFLAYQSDVVKVNRPRVT